MDKHGTDSSDINPKINTFIMALTSSGINVNHVYATLIYNLVLRIEANTLDINLIKDIHDSIVDEKINNASKLIKTHLQKTIPDVSDDYITELAELFIGDVKTK